MRFWLLIMKVLTIVLAASVLSHAGELEIDPVLSVAANHSISDAQHENIAPHPHNTEAHCSVHFLPFPTAQDCTKTTKRDIFSRSMVLASLEKSYAFDPPPPRL